MKCERCGHDPARMTCPKCGELGEKTKSKGNGYKRFECGCGHKWSIGARWERKQRAHADVREIH